MMLTSEIVTSFKKLPKQSRLKIIEMVINTLYDTEEDKLEKAALSMINDYRHDQELTAFTSLDMETFY